MPTFNTQQFIQGAKQQGFNDQQITSFLVSKGIDASQPKQEIAAKGQTNLLERLRLSFGSEEAKGKQQALERQAGLKGKFDIGDIADVAGAVPGIVGFGAGTALGGVAGGALGAGAGEATKQAIGGLLGVQKEPEFGKIATETALGGLVGGAGKLLGLAGKTLKPAASKVGGGVGELVLGTERKQAINVARTNPFFKSFRTGATTIDDVAKQARNYKATIQTKSINSFQKVLENTKGSVNKFDTIKTINNAVRKDLGLEGKSAITRAIEGTQLTAPEVRNVKNVLSTIKGHKDWSVKGVQFLKQKVNQFYKDIDGFADSNRIITKIAGKDGILNTVTTKKNPALKKALSKASKDIDLLQKFNINVLGKNKANLEITPTKLKQLAKSLSDPNTKQATKELVTALEKQLPVGQRTLLQQLEAFNANEFLGGEMKGIIEAPFQTVANLAGSGLSRGAEMAGQLPTINTPTTRLISKMGLFQALRNK